MTDIAALALIASSVALLIASEPARRRSVRAYRPPAGWVSSAWMLAGSLLLLAAVLFAVRHGSAPGAAMALAAETAVACLFAIASPLVPGLVRGVARWSPAIALLAVAGEVCCHGR